MTEEGRLGAFITRVKEGSIADTVGHLLPGDVMITEYLGTKQGNYYLDVLWWKALDCKIRAACSMTFCVIQVSFSVICWRPHGMGMPHPMVG